MTTIIETKRLILRPLRADDLDTLTATLNNLSISRNTARIPFPYGRNDAEDFLSLTEKPMNGTLFLSIVRKDGADCVCGGISYENGECAELGYWLAEPEWGKGYGREAARAMTDHAFRIARHEALFAGYRTGNEPSRRILEGLGFTVIKEEWMFAKSLGRNVRVVRMGLVRTDWERSGDDNKWKGGTAAFP